MRLQCFHCKAWADFNDGIEEDVLWHVHGWLVWGFDVDSKQQYATCYECHIKDNDFFSKTASHNQSAPVLVTQPPGPFDHFFIKE